MENKSHIANTHVEVKFQSFVFILCYFVLYNSFSLWIIFPKPKGNEKNYRIGVLIMLRSLINANFIEKTSSIVANIFYE